MDSPQTIPHRHETEIDDDSTRGAHPTQPSEDGADNPIVTPSQEITSETNNTNNMTSGMPTSPMGTRINDSTTETATPQMFRQALEAAPNPSSFLQTPPPTTDPDMSWDIEDDDDGYISMYSIILDSFQGKLEDLSLFAHFDVLWLHQIVSFDFKQCIDGSTKIELEDKDFKQFLLKLFVFQTILKILRQDFGIDNFPTTTSLQDSFIAQHKDYFTSQYVHHIKTTHKQQLKQTILSPIRQRLFQLNTPVYHRRSNGGGMDQDHHMFHLLTLWHQSSQKNRSTVMTVLNLPIWNIH